MLFYSFLSLIFPLGIFNPKTEFYFILSDIIFMTPFGVYPSASLYGKRRHRPASGKLARVSVKQETMPKRKSFY
ncbi:MAG: hypothetical protein A2224_01495 [Candidatus Magasanikbacteria bacterium RIFOXYA2_FULL_40_20]|nr:MAG: hypothetical protein A2224_01495 [Candidatus Magasanikbacteria bacterium RIFOXYA2_FULL_40_20]